jgi:hypothetical protein
MAEAALNDEWQHMKSRSSVSSGSDWGNAHFGNAPGIAHISANLSG